MSAVLFGDAAREFCRAVLHALPIAILLGNDPDLAAMSRVLAVQSSDTAFRDNLQTNFRGLKEMLRQFNRYLRDVSQSDYEALQRKAEEAKELCRLVLNDIMAGNFQSIFALSSAFDNFTYAYFTIHPQINRANGAYDTFLNLCDLITPTELMNVIITLATQFFNILPGSVPISPKWKGVGRVVHEATSSSYSSSSSPSEEMTPDDYPETTTTPHPGVALEEARATTATPPRQFADLLRGWQR